jgi:hypothetical protein
VPARDARPASSRLQSIGENWEDLGSDALRPRQPRSRICSGLPRSAAYKGDLGPQTRAEPPAHLIAHLIRSFAPACFDEETSTLAAGHIALWRFPNSLTHHWGIKRQRRLLSGWDATGAVIEMLKPILTSAAVVGMLALSFLTPTMAHFATILGRVDGRWQGTAPRDVWVCAGDIGNINGRLTCSRGGGFGSSFGPPRGRGWGS